MNKKWKLQLISWLICFLLSVSCGIFESEEEEPVPEKANFLCCTFSVAGKIQLDDPWKSGDVTVNDWAKPMYYIWFDMNANFEDGPFANGVGPKQATLRLDTGKLYFEWNGKHGTEKIGDAINYCSGYNVCETEQSEDEMKACLTDDGKSLRVSFPLSKIGNPKTLEVGFMSAPWTTSAADNLGPAAGYNAWIIIKDATIVQSATRDDDPNDVKWPALTPDRRSNFDITKVSIHFEK